MVPLQQNWMLQANDFSKKTPPKFFFWSSANFFSIDIEQLLVNSSENILSKKVKEVVREFQWNCKGRQSEPLRKLYCRHFHNIPSELCLNGVSMDRCQHLWLLHSRKVVGYKVEIPILDPWILKEGEVRANESRQGKGSWLRFKVFWGWKKLPIKKENVKRYHKDQMLIY